MVIKERIGRKRYILFLNEGKSKNEILNLIDGRAYLAFYSKNFAIVRCKHTEKDKIIAYLKSMGFKTIKTSGTIKKLKKYINSFYINSFSPGGAMQ